MEAEEPDVNGSSHGEHIPQEPRQTDPDEDFEIENIVKSLVNMLKVGNESAIVECLNEMVMTETLAEMDQLNRMLKEKSNGETLLHIALKFKNTHKFITEYLSKRPYDLMEKRACRKKYEGQTPLHVAIVKGNTKAVEIILKTANEHRFSKRLLKTCAVGKKYRNTVLIGQLPFSVAALACRNKNFQIIKYLLKEVDVWRRNKDGDTVFHSLIIYADIYPGKMKHIRPTFEYIWSEVFQDYICESQRVSKNPVDSQFWKKMENSSGLTPLHLSAKLGVSELFDFIINTQNVYRFTNIQDGLFDIRKYDVTEFDRLISYTSVNKSPSQKEENSEDKQNAPLDGENVSVDDSTCTMNGSVKAKKQANDHERKITILESLFDSKCSHTEAFQILNHQLVQFILHRKWLAYRKVLLFWMAAHFIFVLLFTISTMEKSRLFLCSQNTSSHCEVGELSKALVSINVGVGIIYLIFAVLCIMRLVGRCTAEKVVNIGLMWHNLDYIICLLFIAIGVLLESILIYFEIHWDYHLVLALIGGWYFLLYFTPFNKSLVSFTYMIKSGFFEDFLPFALVFLFLLTSFTAIIDMLYRGTEVEEFNTFGNSFLTMFNLGVGLNDIGVLNKSRIPWLAYTLFVIYVILSFIHLFNALVAVMSQTFSGVHQDRNAYQKYNRLRMIEMFEDIFLVRLGTKDLLFLNRAKHWIQDNKDEEERSSKNKDIAKKKKDVNKQDSKKKKEDISNQGTRNDNENNDSNEPNNGRFYSILQLLDDLEDYRDDNEEKKSNYSLKYLTQYLKNRTRNKINTAGLKKFNKTNPEGDVTFNIQLQNKSSQYP